MARGDVRSASQSISSDRQIGDGMRSCRQMERTTVCLDLGVARYRRRARCTRTRVDGVVAALAHDNAVVPQKVPLKISAFHNRRLPSRPYLVLRYNAND